MYWAIVTLTTVQDLIPQTGLGKAIAACAMIAGYAIIAVPTGIVTVELNRPCASGAGPFVMRSLRGPVDRPEALLLGCR